MTPQTREEQIRALVRRMTEDDGYAEELVAREVWYVLVDPVPSPDPPLSCSDAE